MAKYEPSDDGKTIEGKLVVFLSAPRAVDLALEQSDPSGKRAADGDSELDAARPAAPGLRREDPARAREALAFAQSATLAAAAKNGAAFCEECEQAKQRAAR